MGSPPLSDLQLKGRGCVFGEPVQFPIPLHVQQRWHEIFLSMPYSNFWSIECLIRIAGCSFEEFLTAPMILKQKITKDVIMKYLTENASELAELPFKPGVCDSFAVQTCRFLQSFPDEQADFSFEYHDMGRHRLARCHITGMVVDSSSDMGSFRLSELGKGDVDTETATYGELPRQKTLKFTNGVFEEKGKSGIHISKRLSSDKETLAKSLYQVSQQPPRLEPLCYFRSAIWKKNDGSLDVSYAGMIKWDLNKKQLYLIPDYKKKNEHVATFDWQDLSNTKIPYHLHLANFVFLYGGENGTVQWYQCHLAFRQIWTAACKTWGGYPSVKGSSPATQSMPNSAEFTAILYTSMHAVDCLNPCDEEKYSKMARQMEVVERMTDWGALKIVLRENEETGTAELQEDIRQVRSMIVDRIVNRFTRVPSAKAPGEELRASIPLCLSPPMRNLILAEVENSTFTSSEDDITDVVRSILNKGEAQRIPMYLRFQARDT